jgi:uncharacterized protein (UPF0210 family)
MSLGFTANEIWETIRMVQMENLDIRTITMGISLRDCAADQIDTVCTKAYDTIWHKDWCRQEKKLNGNTAFLS